MLPYSFYILQIGCTWTGFQSVLFCLAHPESRTGFSTHIQLGLFGCHLEDSVDATKVWNKSLVGLACSTRTPQSTKPWWCSWPVHKLYLDHSMAGHTALYMKREIWKSMGNNSNDTSTDLVRLCWTTTWLSVVSSWSTSSFIPMFWRISKWGDPQRCLHWIQRWTLRLLPVPGRIFQKRWPSLTLAKRWVCRRCRVY